EEIKLIKIPVPPIEVQRQIIEKFESAYNAKRAKEAEAKSLLNSIDAYLLERLGIETPAVSDTKKTFFVRSSKLFGGRFDPSFYKPNFQNLVGELEKQSNKRLREIVKFSSESWNQKDFFENTFPYIEISEIDLSKGEINNVNQILLTEAPSRAKMIVRRGDIIVSTTRPNRGAIAKITEKEDFSIASTGFAVIRHVDSKILVKDFLHSVLRHRICLLQMEQRSSGGNYPAITVEELGNLLIPVPPLEIQAEIAAHIQSIREHAKELEREAQAEIERAKAEAEKMILGEVAVDA
ncbi:MAG: restriction endonuclease subunit S, partial [Acidobacteriota bacterium]|nr:restriction endonuclease subunit S [Acidobacteriota bacterium]